MTLSNIPSLYEVIVVSLLIDTRDDTTTTFCNRENISISKDTFFFLSVVAISTSNTLVVPIFEIE